MNKYSYKGKLITASSKQEAIHKIVADSILKGARPLTIKEAVRNYEKLHKPLNEKFNKTSKPKIDMKVVNKWAKKNMSITDEGLGKDHWKNPKTGEVYYTYKAAERLSKKVGGYHIPTNRDWEKLFKACCCELDSADDESIGFKDYIKCGNLIKLLNIKPTGIFWYSHNKFSNPSHSAVYWTSSKSSYGSMFIKEFRGTWMKADDWSTDGLSVRLVKD